MAMLRCVVIGALALHWGQFKGSLATVTRSSPRVRHLVDKTWTCPFKQRDISCRTHKAVVRDLVRPKARICLWDPNTVHHPMQLSAVNVAPMIELMRNCSTSDATMFALSSVQDVEFARQCCGRDTYSLYFTTEPPEIDPKGAIYVTKNSELYDLVLTLADHNHGQKQLPNAMTWPLGGSWIPPSQWGMHPKTKLCSIIASSKTDAPGHQLRHEVVQLLKTELGGLCDVFGRGYAPLADKSIGLKDYMFSIVIENSINGRYMSEKLIDAMALGTVPIYWGTREAELAFSVIPWRTLEDLKRVLRKLDARLYKRMRFAARSNLDKARAFETPEQWLWDNVLKCAYEWHASHPPANCPL